MNTNINSTKSNSPSFGMAARLTPEVIDLAKKKSAATVDLLNKKVNKVHVNSDEFLCDVEFILREVQNKKGDSFQYVIAKALSQEDGMIKGNEIAIPAEKFGNRFTTFFGKIKRSITDTRFKQEDINSLGEYTTAQITTDVIDLAKRKPSKVVARLNREVGKIDNFADELGCNVDIGLRQSSRNSRRPIQHVVAKVSSQSDPEIKSKGTYLEQEKFGNMFTGFFKKIEGNIKDVNLKEESINELSKFQ